MMAKRIARDIKYSWKYTSLLRCRNPVNGRAKSKGPQIWEPFKWFEKWFGKANALLNAEAPRLTST
jgi:hypothetical protein